MTSRAAPTADLDEWFDRAVSRPVAARIAGWLQPTPVSANQVTLVSGFIGVAAGVFCALPDLWPLAGAACVLLMLVFDCADGHLARLRSAGGTWQGRVYDGLADYVTGISVSAGMCIHLYYAELTFRGAPLSLTLLITLTVLTALSAAWNASVLDGLKQILKGDDGHDRVLLEPPALKGRWDRILYWILTRYVTQMRTVAGKESPVTYEQYRRVRRVGPTNHYCWIFIAACLTPWVQGAFLVYFAISIVPANLHLLWAMLRPASDGQLVDAHTPGALCEVGVGNVSPGEVEIGPHREADTDSEEPHTHGATGRRERQRTEPLPKVIEQQP